MRTFLIIVAVILLIVVAGMSYFTVGPTEYVYVTQFGRHIATFDGSNNDDAGLHFRWPWPIQSVQRLDRRLQYFDLPRAELLTRDANNLVGLNENEQNRIDKMLIVEAYACWKIHDKELNGTDPVDLFIRRLGTIERAQQDILGPRIISQLGAVFGQLSAKDLISTDASLVDNSVKQVRKKVLDSLKEKFLSEYGIELVDVRLRRFYYSPQVRESIFADIRSERNQKAEESRSLGKQLADKIRSDADKKASEMLADARKYEKIKKGEADAKAAEIRNEANNKDPDFYVFLKKLDNLKTILSDNKTMLLLSTHRTFFEMLFQPPYPNSSAVSPGSSTTELKNGGANGKSSQSNSTGPEKSGGN